MQLSLLFVITSVLSTRSSASTSHTCIPVKNSTFSYTCDDDCGEGLRSPRNTTAQRIARDYWQLFQNEIRGYDTSPDEQKGFKKSTVALWHKAISKLDIPAEEDKSVGNLFKLKRLLSTIMRHISNAAYPDPRNEIDEPNHDWIGRAGGGTSWKKRKNRANHDSLCHMRSGAVTMHFIHLVRRHRPDVWARVLKARNIEIGTDDERLYLMNFFVAGYMAMILRHDEKTIDIKPRLYIMSEDDQKKIMKQISPEVSQPELVTVFASVRVATAWLFRSIGQAEYYRSLLGRHLEHMVKTFTSVNVVEGKFTDEKGKACAARAFLYDEHGNEYNIDTVPDNTLAAHFETTAMWVGHYIDHVRLDYSHFTKPRGCGSAAYRILYKKLFGKDMMLRVKESYSFWTYLTQQAGIVSSEEDGDVVFNRMKKPGEIKLELGKTFSESNPWAGVKKRKKSRASPGTLSEVWAHLTMYPPMDEAQGKFHALCNNFDEFFDLFFAEEHLYGNLDEGTAKFFGNLFREDFNSGENRTDPGECASIS